MTACCIDPRSRGGFQPDPNRSAHSIDRPAGAARRIPVRASFLTPAHLLVPQRGRRVAQRATPEVMVYAGGGPSVPNQMGDRTHGRKASVKMDPIPINGSPVVILKANGLFCQ